MKGQSRLNPRDPNIADVNIAGIGALPFIPWDVSTRRAINPVTRGPAPRTRVMWSMHLYLAGALGFTGDLDEARTALADALKLKPEINSLARLRTFCPWIANSHHWGLLEETVKSYRGCASLAFQKNNCGLRAMIHGPRHLRADGGEQGFNP